MDFQVQWSILLWQGLGFFVALISCSLFSFLETSITALRPFKLKEIESTTRRYKKLLAVLAHNPHQILVTILIANSFANVTAAALSTAIMENFALLLHISSGVGFSLGIGLGACAILIFGEVIPKSIAKVHGENFFGSTLWVTNVAFYLLHPLVTILIKVSNFFIKLVGGMPGVATKLTSEPEIRFLIEQSDQIGGMEKTKSAMLQSIFKLGYKPVREIMNSSLDVVMLDGNSSLDASLELFSKYQFSRVPVYQNDTDNIIGMIYQKDIFALLRSATKPATIRDLVRPILFVPESMKINQLLHQFKDQCMHIAMVTNEFGSITGLVTLEDVLEEIVGEIRDEYEPTIRKIVPLSSEEWLIDASLDLDALGKLLKINFEVEMAVTLGGFLTEKLQHVPVQGQQMKYKNYLFTVQQATHKRVLQVLIQTQQPSQEHDL